MPPAPPEPFPTTLADFYKYTPLKDKTEPMQKQALISLQAQLKAEKFYTSTVDGRLGPGVEKALIAWQTSKALQPTGRLDAASWAATALGIMEATAMEAELTKLTAATRPESSDKPKSSNRKLSPRGIDYTGKSIERGYYETFGIGLVRIKKDTIGGSLNGPGGKLKPEAAKDPDKVKAWNYHLRTWVDYCQWCERQ